MRLTARIDRLEGAQQARVRPWLVVKTAGRSDDEIIGLSGVPFERNDGESWPEYSARAEQWGRGRSFLAIARYRDDDD